MTRTTARPLLWLAMLLAAYLCAPFIASVPQIGHADWAGVDWRATWSAVAVSAASASVAALIILVGGVPLGYWLARSSSRGMALLGFVVQLPLALPPLTSGVLLLFLLGPYSWIGRAVGGVLTDSFAGIVLAETFVAAPFLIVAARSAFASVDPVFDDVAATLGHHAGSRFFRVMLPIAWPAIRAGLALAWLRAFGEFGATVMVAYHPYSLPVYTYVVFGGQGLPAMMPLLLPTLAIAIVCAALSIYSRSAGRDEPERRLDNGDEPALAAAGTGPSSADQEQRLVFQLTRNLGSFTLDIAWAPSTRRLAIIGPSGSGKSLALRLIAGLEHNDAGTVTLGALDLAALPPERRQIGYMPQDYGLFPHMTVAQQLAFPVDADATNARYWVFDEPFAALDTPRRRRLQQSLRALQREIAAVTVIVTHDPDEAALLADEVLVIEQGRVLQTGSIENVFERPATMRVAELLGVRNIGQGVIRVPGQLEIADGFVLETSDRSLAAGQNVMWRVASRAIALTPDGAHAGIVDAIELRGGERHVRVDIEGVRLEFMSDDARLREKEACRFAIDPHGVSIWVTDIE